MNQDKQLATIRLEDVLEKRRLDQALNAKEFAVCAGISYSTAQEWFRLPGFPVFRGVVFWQDFVQWRTAHSGVKNTAASRPQRSGAEVTAAAHLPPRAARLLIEAS